jgi:hypothetical protein
MDLVMPDKYKEITVKIVDVPYITKEDVYVDVNMFGNPQKWTYRMKIGKTLWNSILKHLLEMDGNRFSEELEPSVINKSLDYLNGRIITVKGTSDETKAFITKAGKVEYGKKFIAEFRSDYEEAETIGGEVYKKAIFEAVMDNIFAVDCIVANSNLAKAEIEKAKNKELKKEEKEKRKTKVDKKQKKLIPVEEEWVKRKVKEQEKENKIQSVRGTLAGW